MNAQINKLSKKSVAFAWSRFALGILFGGVFGIFVWINAMYWHTDWDATFLWMMWSTFAICVATLAANIGLWIAGIVYAVKAHKLTNDSILLVVFSVFTLWIGHIIVAMLHKKKFKDFVAPVKVKAETKAVSPKQVAERNKIFEIKKLRKAYLDGTINSTEYKTKVKDL